MFIHVVISGIFLFMAFVCIVFTLTVLLTAGIFGVDKAIAARAAYEAVMMLDERISLQYLQTVHFVNIDAATTSVFVEVFKSLHGGLTMGAEVPDQRKTGKDGKVEDLRLQHIDSSQRKQKSSQADNAADQQLPSTRIDVDHKSPMPSEPFAATFHSVAVTDSQNIVPKCTDPFHMATSCGIDVQIYRGNLLDETVDAIVNPANIHLTHGGGAARAIAEAAGHQLQEECRAYISEHKELKVTQVMHTAAGKLYPPIIYVIHVAGPSAAHFHSPDDLYQAVVDTFYHCLLYANNFLHVSSLSIPAISSGENVYECSDSFTCADLGIFTM